MKLWSTQTGQCLRTFRGHVNEKSFVGITANNGYLLCGEFDNFFNTRFILKICPQYLAASPAQCY